MTRTSFPSSRRSAAVLALCAGLAAQDPDRPVSRPGGPPPGSPPGLPAGMTEEQMWPVPTEADWQKPVLVPFQRSWEDAVAVSRETGKPILVCINMDGEIASEHYAGILYRSEEFAKRLEPYVCVIASVYRHNPRDHDEHGHRIPCPRLGSVTCGEHIELEPFLYERYLDGQRISPRHIMVELDGKEVFDVFFSWDIESVVTTVVRGIAERSIRPEPVVRGDRSIVERVRSRDLADRIAVEDAFRNGDRGLRDQLLKAALEHPEAAPVELLRLAVFGLDEAQAELAREALARVDDASAVDLVAEALRVPMPDAQREALVGSLERISGRSPRARLLATVHRGLETESKNVDVAGWSGAMQGGGSYAPPDFGTLEQDAEARAAAAAAKPDDADARLALAESRLRLAVDPETQRALAADLRNGRTFARLMFQDARQAAVEARDLGADGWRLDALLGLTAWYLGEEAEAHERAIAAVAAMPAEPEDWTAVATLALFAQARQKAIWDALRQKTDWPREWMTDVNSVYAVLARHPLGDDQHAVTHYDFLDSLGAKGRAERVLADGLARFPDSPKLHDRLQARVLAERGPDALASTYDAMLAAPGASARLPWFAGYAAIVAAEFQRRAGRLDEAVGSYERALAMYGRAIEQDPTCRDTADHYAALALAGRARLAYEQGDLPAAVDLLIAGIERRPDATANVDGLNVSPAMTARLLVAKLTENGDAGRLARLQAVLDQLDPRLLELPEFERAVTPPRRGGRRGR
jgi:tetratricopeptide (TPR) repeat protein